MKNSMKKSVIQWMDEATPEEISEALLSIGIEKAAQVVVYLMARIEPEVKSTIGRLEDQFNQDPKKVMKKVGLAALKGLLGS